MNYVFKLKKYIILYLALSIALLTFSSGYVLAETFQSSISIDSGQTWDSNYSGKTYYSDQSLVVKLESYPYTKKAPDANYYSYNPCEIFFWDGSTSFAFWGCDNWANPIPMVRYVNINKYYGAKALYFGQLYIYKTNTGYYEQKRDDSKMIYLFNRPNYPPVLGFVGSKEVVEGSNISFSLLASDQNNDQLNYTASNLPSGASFSGNTFSWTPGYDQSGTYANVHFEVSDGDLIDSEDVIITVKNVDQPSPPPPPVDNNPGGGQQPGGQNPGGGNQPLIAQSTNLSLKASPSSIFAGKVAKLVGQLKATNGQTVANKTVVIKAKVLQVKKKKVKKGKKTIIKTFKRWIWKVIARVKTNAKGQFVKALRPKATTIYQAEFSGDSAYNKASSNAAKITVKKPKKKAKKKKKK